MSWHISCALCKRRSPRGKSFCTLECAKTFAAKVHCKKCGKEGTIVDVGTHSVIDYCNDHKEDADEEIMRDRVFGIHNSRRLTNMLEETRDELKRERKKRERDVEDYERKIEKLESKLKETEEKRHKPQDEATSLINLLYTVKTLSQIGMPK